MFEHMFKYLLLIITHTNDLFRTLMDNVRKKEAKSPIPRKPNFVFFCDDLISTLKKLSFVHKKNLLSLKTIFLNVTNRLRFPAVLFCTVFQETRSIWRNVLLCSEYMFCYISCKGMQELCVCSSAILINR